ncbi:hypothetical protein IPL68_00780 [Candidatus Saccharibacteria bacterium]|nr:MAG: hypothetical protein IPL68_00780 [Candidatus Saccharibacteria bacterium]
MKRVTFYLDDDEYRQLKIVLAIHGMSASEWLRHEISRYVRGSMPNLPVDQLARMPRIPKKQNRPVKPDDFDEDVDLQ